jgi:glycosyltransferase involved in cell wall biosynthesis
LFSICRNEEATIGRLLDRLPTSIDRIDEIERLVVSDGSSDRTVEVARQRGVRVIDGQRQRRLAYRFQQAVDTALAMGADIAVNIDGDLQFDPDEIAHLVAPIVAGTADVVVGDRFLDPVSGSVRRPVNMPWDRYLGNRVGARVVSRLVKQHFNDVTCGYRAYGRTALLHVNIHSRYTYTQESLQSLCESGLVVQAMPVSVQYFSGRRSRVVESFTGYIATSAVNILRAYRDVAPLRFFVYLSLVPLLFGLAATGLVGGHWLTTGRTSPYTSLGIVGGFSLGVGILLVVTALLADMQVRQTRNQERILRQLREVRFARAHDPLVA